MLKRISIVLTSLLLLNASQAQSDIKVMLKQIALIAVHVKELENAIEIDRDGLTTIQEIKNGEFNLHNLFFSSLQSVNPAVTKYSRIAVIISDQISINSEFKELLAHLKASNSITGPEIQYVENVYAHLSDECVKTLNDLIAVTSNGKLEMTDDERIKRIDMIYDDMTDKYAFTRQFSSNGNNLIGEKDNEEKDLRLIKALQ
jgi:hypothetical protein